MIFLTLWSILRLPCMLMIFPCISRILMLLWSNHRNFCPTKKCPRIKIFRKFLSHGIKNFVIGQNISETFCPRTKIFRKFLSHPNKICPTPKIFRKDKACLAGQTTFSSSSTAIGKGRKVAKRRKGGLDNKTTVII